MDGLATVHPVGSNEVQVEVVTSDGRPVTTRPIRVEELLQQEDHTLDVGDGIALRLEELNAEQHYSDDDEDDVEDANGSGALARRADASSASSSSSDDDSGAGAARGQGSGRAGAPPGTHATSDWYDVLDALRREQHEVERTAAEVESRRRTPQDGEGRLVTRNPNSVQSTATPLKRFYSNQPSTATRSIAGDRSPAPAPGASRRDVWASLAPPKDKVPHNYNVLRYVSYMSALDYRRFRPTALAFHAAASYLSRKDRGQRFLVYGGLAVGARKVEQELYEFSVLTGNWRRMEGRQLVPAGHYGHTLTVVEPLDRVVVIGGIGPGGGVVTREVKQQWAADPLRAPRYQNLCPLLRRGGLVAGALGIGAATARPANAAGGTGAVNSTTPIGFVSLLFDVSLGDLAWRAIQPAQPFPLAYHTAVHFEKEIFVFGGLTEELRVSGQLLAVNPETYAVRLVAPPSTARGPSRSRRGRSQTSSGGHDSRSSRSGGGTHDDEAATASHAVDEDEDATAAGPGPRFLHAAVRFGPYMILYGGYNAHNEVQSDCWAFDMVNERWEKLRCRGEAAGRAGHECCVVGCRMIVTGGFECSLEEMTTAAPAATVMELNLVPTTQGEHLWRSAVKLHPALPPLAFTRCAPCGEDHSFVLFGGLTQPPRRRKTEGGRGAGGRAASAKRRAQERSSEEEDGSGSDDGDADDEAGEHGRQLTGSAGAEADTDGHKGLLRRFAPFDDGLVFTFPVRQQHRKRSEEEPVVNALGVEVDPNELPEHFKTFVRRQEDFIKKKDAAAVDTMRKTTLEEQEGMEPALYLTDDEIDLLLQRSEDCCVAFAQRYPMSTLPSNVPDRDERVHLIEECISESRQVRDVLKSMKGSAPGVTAVKSKSHRKRAGQKFEDYSAAKPFRRVVVMHLIASMNSHLARMHRLNKALRTVDWEEKTNFLEAVDDMQDSVHAVSRAVNGVLRKYIQHRVDSLMKGVDKHKEVMRLLTQVVEKNRHDKIWGVEEARDAQRQQSQRGKAAPARAGRSTSRGTKRSPSTAGAAAGATVHRPHTVSRTRSLGGGYHADEAKAVVYLVDKEWTELLARTQAVEKCAGQLQRYCQEGISSSATAAPAPQPVLPAPTEDSSAGVAPALVPGSGPVSLPVPQAGNASAVPTAASATAPSPVQPPPLTVQQLMNPAQSTLPLPTLLVPPAAAAAAAAPLPATAPATIDEAVPTLTASAAAAGAARPRDILIRHSDELRNKTAAVAEEVRAAAATFYTTLTEKETEQGGAQKDGAAPSSSSSSSSVSQQAGRPSTPGGAPMPPAATSGNGAGAGNAAAAAPQLLLPPPVIAAAGAPGTAGQAGSSSLNNSRSSSSSSFSSGSASSSVTPQSLSPAPAAQNVAPPQLSATAAVGLPAPATAALALPDAAGPSAQHVVVAPPPPSAHDSPQPQETAQQQQQQRATTKRAPETTPPAVGHAMYLGSLRPLLAAKEALAAMKDQVTLIRKNDWDGNDLAGAPQDAKVEELYRRLERLITAVTQSVTASFLTKAGARPPRVRPASTAVVCPPQRAKSQRAKPPARAEAATRSGQQPAPPPPTTTLTPELRDQRGSPAAQPLALSGASLSRREASVHSGLQGAGSEALRLRPLPSVACNDDDWWKLSNTSGSGRDAKTAQPLVPADALLRNVRLESTTAPSDGPAAKLAIQPVFQHTRTVPNTDVTGGETPVVEGSVGRGPQFGLFAVGAGGATRQTSAAVVSLSVAPKVIMPQQAEATSGVELNGTENRRSSGGAASPMQRRTSTIEELTQLPAARSSAAVAGSGSSAVGELDVNMGTALTREPITSITGGNFAVNTEYLYRAAPHTLPVGLSHSLCGVDSFSADPAANGCSEVAGKHAWADVDDDYFYFGRPVEHRVAAGDTTVTGPPYVATGGPALSTGQVGVSPAVGSVVGTQRVNVELAPTARRPPSTSRRSLSGRRGGEGYRSITASVAQKSQTARPVRKEGAGAKSFYTPGELQLMQARERLRSKPQKH